MRSAARERRLGFLAAFAIAIFAGVRLPRADDPHYIDFAGPRAFDVWSNAAFLLVGIAGLIVLLRARRRLADPGAETWPVAIFFLGNIATCFGSAYFHAQPELGWRLAWDRLPMTIAFAGFLGMHVNERIAMRVGTRLMIPLAMIGAATVAWWLYTKDLSFYSAFQAFAAGGTVFMLVLFAPLYTGDRWYWIGVVLYGVAKVLELGDKRIYDAIGIAGHPLKHIAAAATTAMVAVHLARRERIHPVKPVVEGDDLPSAAALPQ
jgi:hypothetical protein